MSTVQFLQPRTVDEAVSLLGAHSGARPLAGGTDLVVHSRSRRSGLPPALIHLGAIPELAMLRVDAAGRLHLGAMVSHATIETAEAITSGWPALGDASSIVGSPATRNVGTVGGNLCNGSPAMEIGAPLVVYRASVTLIGATGARSVDISDFLLGPGRTARDAGEVLTEVVVPPASESHGSAYIRLGFRRAMEIAVVGAAAAVRLAADGRVEDCRIALTAVAPTIVRATAAENELRGNVPLPETIRRSGDAARESASPIGDVRAPASYRLDMVSVITRRTLELAFHRATLARRATNGAG